MGESNVVGTSALLGTSSAVDVKMKLVVVTSMGE
jgi:hypothetical protein